jgi:PAS domain S-box-containing protein
MYDARLVDEFARRLNEKVRYLRTQETDLSRPTRMMAEAVIHDLEQSAEELRVTSEELRSQSDQLLMAGRAIDAERVRFERLFDLAPDPCIVTDMMGGIQELNRAAAKLIGVERTLLQRKPFAAFLSAESTREFRSLLTRLGRMEAVRDVALVLTPRLGGHVPMSVRATLLPASGEEVERVLWVLRNQSDLANLDAVRRDLAREKESREVAEARAEQSRYLVHAAGELGVDLDPRRVASRAARLAADFGDYATVELSDGDGELTMAGAFHPDLPEHTLLLSRSGRRVSAGASSEIVRFLESSGPLFVPAGESIPAPFELDVAGLSQDGDTTALVLVPLTVQGRVVGLLRVVATTSAGAQQLTAWVPLLEAFAGYVSMALHNAHLLRDAESRRHMAEESSRGRIRAMAGLSHELRTPLHSILGYSELLLDGVAGELGDKAAQYVSSIRGSALHQSQLVDDILALARPDRTPRVSLSEVMVEELVQECVEMIAERARANDVQLRVDVASGTRLVTDRSKLSQVLINLLTNAVKFAPDGEVELIVRDEESRVVFDVRDTGCGIGAAELPHIFEPFWQGSASERGGGEGAGLGLSLVGRLVGVLGGTVAVDSVERVGSTFRVSLPCERAKG